MKLIAKGLAFVINLTLLVAFFTVGMPLVLFLYFREDICKIVKKVKRG